MSKYLVQGFVDPSQGPFISEDPLGLDGGINYVEDNPINFDDPSELVKLPLSRTGTRPCNAAEAVTFVHLVGMGGCCATRIPIAHS